MTTAGRTAPGRPSVGLAGFEPTTPGTQSQCATKLRYSPPVDDGEKSSPRSHPPAPPSTQPTDPVRPANPVRYGMAIEVTRPPSARGRSSMVEPQSSKLATRVRFPSPALLFPRSEPYEAILTALLKIICHPFVTGIWHV